MKTLAPVLALIAATAFADNLERIRIRTTNINGVSWRYSIRGESLTLGGGYGGPAVSRDTTGRVEIPSEIDGYVVSSYAERLFDGCDAIEEVVFPKNATASIYGNLFLNCASLRRVVFPARVQMIRGNSERSPLFVGCPSIEELVFPGSVPYDIRYLGVSLDGRLRFPRSRSRAWMVFVEDHDITDWQFIAESENESPAPAQKKNAVPDLDLALVYVADNPACKPLETAAVSFRSALAKKKEETEKKIQAVDMQMKNALARAKQSAQDNGDLDGVLLFEEAMNNPDMESQSDNPTLASIQKKRNEMVATLRSNLAAEQLRVLLSAAEKLEAMKQSETKKGNIALAKEVATYLKSVEDYAKQFKSNMESTKGPQKTHQSPPQKKEPSKQNALDLSSFHGQETTVSVSVNKANGTNLGRLEKGDLLFIQYLDGLYYPYSSSSGVNPDARNDYYYSYSSSGGDGRIQLEGPLTSSHTRLIRLPSETENKPFAITIQEAGNYALKCYAGSYSKGKIRFKVTKLTLLNAKNFERDGNKSAYQWGQ